MISIGVLNEFGFSSGGHELARMSEVHRRHAWIDDLKRLKRNTGSGWMKMAEVTDLSLGEAYVQQ